MEISILLLSLTIKKNVKPFFSDKVSTTTTNISLSGNDTLHDNDTKVADIFGNFFSNIVMDLKLVSNDIIIEENANETDPIIKGINKYDKHPSILKIKEFVDARELFSLSPVDEDRVIKEIYSLVVSKAAPNTSIPPNIKKEHCDIFSKKIYLDFNTSIVYGIFPGN